MPQISQPETYYAPAERLPLPIIHRQAAFFEDPQLVDNLLSAMPNSVLILNQQRQIVYANDSFFGILPDEAENEFIIGKRPGEALHCLHAFETAAGCGTSEFCSTCGAVNAILKAQTGTKSVQECQISTEKDGEIGALDLRIWATPFEFSGEPFTIFAVLDISHEKRRRILENLFFHDIINTAGAIQGMIQIIESARAIGESGCAGLDKMLSQASQQLLDEISAQQQLMAAESGELGVTTEYLQSLSLLEQLADAYRNHVVIQNRTIQVDPQSVNVPILTDRALLGRVLGNMIKNAVEASQANEIITLGCDRQGEFLRFWVHNRNFIPRRIQLQIFKRSFSTKGQGRGLGTYSMKLLAEQYLQGKISFTSQPETGTKFVAEVPLIWQTAVAAK